MAETPRIWTPEEDFVYIDGLMERTSRTFAYTLKKLPVELQKHLIPAYQAYRTIDQIEDSPIPIELKMILMNEVLACFETLDMKRAKDLESRIKGVPAAKTGYRELLDNVSRVVNSFRTLPREVKDSITRHGREMADGLSNPELKRITTLEDHHRYCHYAAAVVGHLITEDLVLSGYLPKEAAHELMPFTADNNPPIGTNRAHDFGVALQLTNDIRDFPEDYAMGSPRWPTGLAEKYGIRYERLADKTLSGEDLEKAAKVLAEQIDDAKKYVLSGIPWIEAMPYKVSGKENVEGIRLSWGDALAFSAATLRAINTPLYFTDENYRKISRSEVNKIDKTMQSLIQKRIEIKPFIEHLFAEPASTYKIE